MQYHAAFAPVDDAPWSPEYALPVEERRIITAQEFRSSPAIIQVDARVLRALDDRPERILSLNWREFEMFVADLLERLGYRTRLSPKGRDGGYDIVAVRETDIGPERVLVQCKRLTPPMKVGEPIVKQFCTVIGDDRATRGLIATTSTFTSVALKYIETKKHTVSGADLGKLREWMQRGR
jgi:restriction endonuclease Mrr